MDLSIITAQNSTKSQGKASEQRENKWKEAEASAMKLSFFHFFLGYHSFLPQIVHHHLSVCLIFPTLIFFI